MADDLLTVKISSRGSGKALNLSQFTGNSDNEWRGCRFVVNDDIDSADAWFVSEDVDDDETACAVPGGRVAFLTAETAWPVGYYDEDSGRSRFLQQFAEIYTCHDIFRPNVTATLPFLPWMINANHGPSITAPHERDVNWLRNADAPVKTADLSVFCSAKTMTEGHRLRLRFVEKLKDHFGERLAWFGNGVQQVDEKWDGIAPYRYHLVLENHAGPNVITEKLWDAYLGHAFPIYWGAPNVGAFLPRESMALINLMDLNGSIATIERLLASDTAEQRRDAIAIARDLVTGDLHYLSRIAEIAHCSKGSMDQKVQTSISPIGSYGGQPPSLAQRAIRRLRR